MLPFLMLLFSPLAAQGQALQVFPRVISVETMAVDFEEFSSTEDFLQIRVETRFLHGSKWCLWIQMVVPPESLGERLQSGALAWTARAPFISGNLLPNERVLIGEGPIDGHRVEGRLIWRATKEPPVAGEYKGRIALILEEWP